MIKRLVRDEKGQAIAEFSLVVFLLVLILFSILEVGMMINAKMVVLSSAREIARICAVEGGNTSRAQERIGLILDVAGINLDYVRLIINPTQAIYGTTIQVTLEYDYKIISPVVGSLAGPTIMLSGKAVTRSEFVPR